MARDALDALVLDTGDSPRHSSLPLEVFSGTALDPRPRLQTETGDTSFFEGRQFRVYHEFNLAGGAALWLRFNLAVDTMALHRTATIVQGNARIALVVGGTASGVWTPKTVVAMNAMASRSSPYYVGVNSADVGGSVAGGTERYVQLIETGGANSTTIEKGTLPTGFPAGTAYVQILNTAGGSALRGTWEVVWEEIVPRSALIRGGLGPAG